jgi:hypothetical protein
MVPSCFLPDYITQRYIQQLIAHVLAAASANTPPAAAVRCAAALVCAQLARAPAALPSPQDEMTALLHQGALHLQMPVAQAARAVEQKHTDVSAGVIMAHTPTGQGTTGGNGVIAGPRRPTSTAIN